MSPRSDKPNSRNAAQQVERAVADVATRLDQITLAAGEANNTQFGAIAAAAVAHEVRNMLTPVRARLELALLALGDSAFVERSVREALKGVERAGRAAEAVLSVVRGRVDIGDGADVADATNAAAGWVEIAGFRIVREVPAGIRVARAAPALEQIMVNLLMNARVATGKGTVYVRVSEPDGRQNPDQRKPAAGRVVIEVEDRGVGAAGGLFGVGGDATAKRGGVGLVVCRHLVEAVGGLISAQSLVGVGTVVRIELERLRAKPAQGAARGSRAA